MSDDVNTEFDFTKRYRVDGWGGIAWYVTEYDSSQELVSDYYEDDDGSVNYAEWEEVVDKSRVKCVMVGDDRVFTFGIDELTPLEEDEFCPECGQIGCKAYNVVDMQ